MVINSVDRALDIIVLLYEEGREMGISEMAERLDLHKSTIYRTLFTLEQRGFVKQNAESEKYSLGMKLYAIGMYLSNKDPLKEIIRPYTKALCDEFREVVNVSVLDKQTSGIPRSIIIHKEQSDSQLLTVTPAIGSSSECYVSAVGKCLLAFSDVDLSAYKDAEMIKYTDHTLRSWEELMVRLDAIRTDGYALDDEEQEIGLTCIGAPVLDRNNLSIAAVSLSGPTQRMRADDFDYKIKRVKETARLISEQFK